MKKKIILTCIISMFIITGCGKKDKINENTSATNIDNNQSSSIFEDDEDIKNNQIISLSKDEKKFYDKYKKDKKIEIFKDKEPLTILKIYTKLIENNEDLLAYNLFNPSSTPNKEENPITQEDFTNLLNDTRKEYLKNLKYAINGKFIEENENSGYIEYEISEDHPLAIDMIKNNNIWKVSYIYTK